MEGVARVKVLLINYEFPPVGGGAGNATFELSKALVSLSHEPVVLTAAYHGRTPAHIPDEVRLMEVLSRRTREDRASIREMASFVWHASIRIRRILREEKPDVMWAFFSIPCGPIAWWGWRATGIPYLVLLRGGDVPGNEPGLDRIHQLLRPLRHAVMRNARAVIANSDSLKAASEKTDPFPVSVVPNGVDTEFWYPPSEPRPALPHRYLFVGRLHPQKNIPAIFAALAEKAKAGELFEFHLIGDGPQRAELQTLSEQLGLSSRTTWHGWLSREALRAQYQRCHIIINFSHYEGMSNALLEAQACGMEVWGNLSNTTSLRKSGILNWENCARMLLSPQVPGKLQSQSLPTSNDSFTQ